LAEREVLGKIRDCIVDINLRDIRDLVKKALTEGIPAYKILRDGMCKGMEIVGLRYEIVGLRYETGEYFLTELVGAGAVMKEGMEELSPHLKIKRMKPSGRVVIGTVMGDVHDIGKDIVKMLLTSAGFKVEDLGVDVPAEEFVKRVKETKADIVALSALLTTTMQEMKRVIEELEKTGLREEVKIIIGGAPITKEFCQEIGADAAAEDAAQGVRICKQWMEE